MSNAAEVTVITPARRAAAVIRKGQRAWTEIKATAEEQRTLWLEVGVALMYGKIPENRPVVGHQPGRPDRPTYQKFSAWVVEMFPGLIHRPTIVDAMWFGAFCTTVVQIPPGLTHPTSIRKWADNPTATVDLDAEEEASIPPELKATPAPTQDAKVDHDTGRLLSKMKNRRSYGGEGADMADRGIKAYAKKHGLTEEELLKAAANAAPDEFYLFPLPLQKQLKDFRDGLQASVDQMKASGISIDAIRSIYINLANSL